MKKCRKTTVSFLLVLSILFSLAAPAFANDGISPLMEWDVTMTIASYPRQENQSSLDHFGHAFLAFYNDSSVTITIGHMKVAPGSSVTIGTYQNRPAHKGIWYNVEGYNLNLINSSEGLATLTISLSQNQLSTVNAAINGHDHWSHIDNCASFARGVWNSVTSGSMQLDGMSPAELCSTITGHHPGYGTSLSTAFIQPISKIAYHTSTSYVYDTSGAAAASN